jgi:signal transduction histidine kinase
MKVQLLCLIALVACSCVKRETKKSLTTQYPTSPDYEKARHFDSIGRKDSAYFYYNNVTQNSKDSFLAALSYYFMAEIEQNAGDFIGVQESALAGLKLVNKDSSQQYACIASLNNIIGRSYLGLKYFDDAIKYYKYALEIQPYEVYKDIYRNNIAVALRDKGNYIEALQTFDSIKVQPNESSSEFARRTTNLASLRWKADKSFNPIPELHKALDIRLHLKDEVDITSSYNHLADYYLTSNNDSALFYAKKMYALAQKTNSTDDQIDALRKLTSMAARPEFRLLLSRYQFLSDSMQIAQSRAKSQFAVIRYESEKSKSENLVLREDNTQKKLQILRQRVFVLGSILLATLIVGGAIWKYRKKRQQVELDSQTAIRENQLKLSQKVHDTVANGLYRMMSEIEHAKTIEKESLLDRIEELYERSRDISYEPIETGKNTARQINQVITAFATSNTKVSVVGNQNNLWADIPSAIVKELEPVLQELMVNMKKHSGARHVVLQFAKSDGRLIIFYKDDGRGFQPNFYKGNGLTSTGNRINQIGGQITFANETANGAEIKIIVPITINDQKSLNS